MKWLKDMLRISRSRIETIPEVTTIVLSNQLVINSQESLRNQGIYGKPDFSENCELPLKYAKYRESLMPHGQQVIEIWRLVFQDIMEFPERRVRIISPLEFDCREFRDAYFLLRLSGQIPDNVELVYTTTCPPGSDGHRCLGPQNSYMMNDIKGVLSGIGKCEFGYVSTIKFDDDCISFTGERSQLPNAKRSVLVLYYDVNEKLRNELDICSLSSNVSFFGYRRLNFEVIINSFEKYPEVSIRVITLNSGQAVHDLSKDLNKMKVEGKFPLCTNIFLLVASSEEAWNTQKKKLHEFAQQGTHLLVLATDTRQELCRELVRLHGTHRVLHIKFGG